MNNIKKYFGYFCQYRRKELKLNQKEFSEINKLSKRVMTEIETGNSSVPFITLLKLCKGLKLNIGELNKFYNSLNNRTYILKELGSILKSKRKELGLTQTQVINFTGVCLKTFVMIEKGKVNIKLINLLNLCYLLRINIGELNMFFPYYN